MLDFCLMRTVPVTVVHREQTGTDAYGAPVWAEVADSVDGCLVEPRATDDLEAARPQGVASSITVHFPKGYTASLRGAVVVHAGRGYRVVGDPSPYMPTNTPGPWNRAVECEACDG